MTDLETAIMIKNMARETVRRMSATTKNAKMSDKAQAFINEIKRDQKTDALTAKMSLDTIMRYAREQAAGREIKADDVMYGFMKEKTRVEKSTAKNATSLKEGDKVRKKNNPDRKGRIELITGGVAMVFWPEDQTTSGIAIDKIERA